MPKSRFRSFILHQVTEYIASKHRNQIARTVPKIGTHIKSVEMQMETSKNRTKDTLKLKLDKD